MANYDLIRQAIVTKQQIHATYDVYHREMCPHVLGTKNGADQCLFYQFGGQSKSGLSANPIQNWRCIPIARLTNVKLVSGAWQSASNHSRAQTCVDIIDVEVDF